MGTPSLCCRHRALVFPARLFQARPVAAVLPIPVVAVAAQSGDVPIYVTGLGTVQAYNTVTVHVRVNGALDKVVFIEGQDVKAGDLLAQIDPRPYQAQLDQVVAAKARDEALLANARLDLQRYDKLASQNSIAMQQRDTQTALVAQYVATVKNDQGQIDFAAVQLAYTAVRSPIAGRTGVRMIDAGNIVQTTDTTGLVVVTQLEPISVLFTLPEDDFETVNRQMSLGTLTVAASSRADNKVLGWGNRAADQQPDRSNHRHDTIEGDVPEHGSRAVAGAVRRHPAAGGDAAWRDHRAVRRRAARSPGRLRLCPEPQTTRPRWRRSKCRPPTRGTDRADRIGRDRRRTGRDRRPVEASHRGQRQAGSGGVALWIGTAIFVGAPFTMSISEPFIRRPIGTTLLAAGLLMIGVVAFPMLPIAPLPQVDFPTIQVSTSLPGASAETMAASVTTPLERQFSLIAGVTELTSTSSLGSSSITVQFALDRDIDAAAGDIQSAINAAGGQLPTNLPSPPSYRKVNPADSPILLLSLTSASLPLTVVDNFADNILAQQLSQISGVAQVTINGQQKPAVRIQIDPAKLASLGLSLEDVRTQIAGASADAPKGTLDGAQQSFAVYDNDQILSAAPWNDVIVAYRNGAPVRISDIGRAVDGAENIKLAAWANGKRCILLAVFKQPGANVIDTVNQVKAALPHLQSTIPAAIDVAILADRTQTIRASVSDVEATLVITICLVVARDLPFSAQPMGDHHTRHHRAACRWPAPSVRCTFWATVSTTFR